MIDSGTPRFRKRTRFRGRVPRSLRYFPRGLWEAGGGGIFESFFGGAGGGRTEERQRGSDLRYDMQITLEEAAFGTEKEIEIRKLDTCDQCSGSGAEPGSRSINCPTCGGRGQVISSRGFSKYRKPVRAAGEPDKLSKNRVGNAAAKGGSKIPAGSN